MRPVREASAALDSVSVTAVGERCYRCFTEESADRLGVAFDNTPHRAHRGVDGRTFTYDQIGRMMMTFGGLHLKREKRSRRRR